MGDQPMEFNFLRKKGGQGTIIEGGQLSSPLAISMLCTGL